MHLIFVTSLVPDGEPATGYEIANAAIIDGLRRAGVRVTVLGFVWPGKKPANPESTILLGAVDVRNETASTVTKARWVTRAMLLSLTVSSAKLRVISPTRLRDAIASAGPFDAYVLNAVTLPGAFEQVFQDKPRIFVAHNVEHRSAEQSAVAAGSFVQRLLFGREARLLKQFEARLCVGAEFVFTLAEEDSEALGLAGSGRAACLPLVTRPAAPPAQEAAGYDLGLIGTWTWQPNRIGLEWFLREVVPHLPGDLSIRIGGATPADLKQRFPRAEFAGRVPDAAAFAGGARVVPLVSRAGTGVQLKTIETFELGLPSVATSLSVRGIAALPANCTVADEPKRFAEALADKVRRTRAGEVLRLDGSGFHAAQLRALDQALAHGLAALGAMPAQSIQAAA